MNAKKKVLVIDDAPEIRAAVTKVLRHYDISVAGASNLEEAEQLLKGGGSTAGTIPYDLIVLDVRLDKEDGLELLKKLRGAMHAKVPVLMISGAAEPEVVQKAAALGISGFLVKPFTAQTLWEKIAPLLKSS